MYNNAFGFTSVGANIDKSINNGRGPFVYRIHGVIYHQIGSLFAEESKKPVFSQIYMYDNLEQVNKRMNFPNSEEPLDSEITELLSVMLHRVNALVDIYRQVRDRYKESEVIPGKLRLIANRDTDGRESNVPTNAYDFAGLVANSNLADDRDILVHPHDGVLHRISVLHPCYMSLQYPLLFPWGEDGFRIDILHSGISAKSGNKRDVVTIREYYCYRLQYRDAEGHTLIGGGRLFLQFVVDAWACIEHTRLTWVLTHQTILRSDLYNNVVDSVNKGDTNASTIGKRIVLPSSFTGSPRYMQQNYQDCMAICRKFGSPDLFITFTCNPQWPEIKEYCDKVPHCIPADRPDVMARVFKIKLELLLEDLTDNHVLGKVIGVAYTIEFQKRGLPHAHIIVWLEESDKCHSTDDIDQLICAEIPDKESDEIGYDAVSRHMIHGPCGAYNIDCPCMKDGKCTKYYPKEFTNETTIDSNGYPVYRRRDDKHTVHFKEKDIEIDNRFLFYISVIEYNCMGCNSTYLTYFYCISISRFVVPYNRGLLVKYQAHINIEWCNQGRLIKYMFKYVNKGPDRATVVVETADAVVTNATKQYVNINEVEEYVSCRYLSSAEACWRIFEFPIHHHKPVVIKLVFHLENEQQVYFREDETLTTVVDRIDPNATMFIQWFRVNREDPAARELTFVEFPEKYFWDNTGKIWQRRKKKMCVIGRMVYVHPTAGERFYLRMLLNIVKGATSFEDVRTVNGVVYNTYKEACFHHGLLECDDEWHTAITDASTHQTGAQLRELFVTLLLFCDISDVRALWDKHWKSFSDDIEHRQRKHFPNRAFVINDEQLESLTLYDVDLQLRKRGKTLADFPTLPKLDRDLQRQSTNTLLYEENMYDRHALAQVPYADWVVSVGDGVVPTVPSVEGNEPCWIEIPSELNLDPGDDGKKAIIDAVYDELCNSSNDSGYFRDRAILTPLNEDVDLINKEVMKRFTGQSKIYRSVDSVCKSTVNYESMESMYTPEYLNSLRIAGVPNHQLELKIGAPIVLLRNLAPSKGLCNGTRLIVTQLCARVIEAIIVTGNHIGEKAFIPRICMRPSDTALPFTLKRVQFPISLCYAMTINKSQGQTLKYVGLYLPRPVFSHGQFYVAISRVTTPLGLHIVCENETHPIVGMTKNVVYHEQISSNRCIVIVDQHMPQPKPISLLMKRYALLIIIYMCGTQVQAGPLQFGLIADFSKRLLLGSVYLISNYDVAAAPDTYRPVPGEYSVNFHRKTSVKKIGDVPAIPMFQFNLKTFEETRARLGDVVTLIDVVGKLKDYTHIQTAKSGKKSLDIVLADKSQEQQNMANVEAVTIAQLFEAQLPDGKNFIEFYTEATVIGLFPNEGWYYIGCNKCGKKMNDFGQCIKLTLAVKDSTADTSFVIFDRHVMKLINVSAQHLLNSDQVFTFPT
ncbi:hypothetical protein DCAR_0102910 [Daucus carota subsp. sativus]|uniref:ATP-dependent DNA helicase n=1 Tax=Daucus carota subsp. sativus TaxID=79200 RepID=A0AAF1AKF3_DAUCS|nr:hypothetical protein DCAR_0102910 [Daucus carota subsp. sativus]